MEFATLKTFDKSHEAYLLKTKLESEGLTVIIEDEHMVTLDPLMSNLLGGIKLKVPRDQLIRAQTIIGIVEAKPFLDQNNEVVKCIKCGSEKLQKERKGLDSFKDYINFAIAALFFVYPLNKQKFHYKCLKCGAITENPDAQN
ncbi:putative signal transducing protein [Luteibaculum oceani]|uniref:DUF2007 domain-containing protein n=1 Tax=Luteibaculum oceani TaxID=1294296 RepID=A0A5C6VLA2_9FLAO|nr:DUF2007 domain-containing protein [Luteibaculum oceani]TXC85176.1 DUF2007 domain-containing protein [Luteibaculum oceani]